MPQSSDFFSPGGSGGKINTTQTTIRPQNTTSRDVKYSNTRHTDQFATRNTQTYNDPHDFSRVRISSQARQPATGNPIEMTREIENFYTTKKARVIESKPAPIPGDPSSITANQAEFHNIRRQFYSSRLDIGTGSSNPNDIAPASKKSGVRTNYEKPSHASHSNGSIRISEASRRSSIETEGGFIRGKEDYTKETKYKTRNNPESSLHMEGSFYSKKIDKPQSLRTFERSNSQLSQTDFGIEGQLVENHIPQKRRMSVNSNNSDHIAPQFTESTYPPEARRDKNSSQAKPIQAARDKTALEKLAEEDFEDVKLAILQPKIAPKNLPPLSQSAKKSKINELSADSPFRKDKVSEQKESSNIHRSTSRGRANVTSNDNPLTTADFTRYSAQEEINRFYSAARNRVDIQSQNTQRDNSARRQNRVNYQTPQRQVMREEKDQSIARQDRAETPGNNPSVKLSQSAQRLQRDLSHTKLW